MRHVSKGAIEVESAGSVPQADIHPMARLAVRRLLDLDLSGQYPKAVDLFVGQPFDYVITVCGRAEETCPIFPHHPERIHWGFDDPAAVTGTSEEQQRAFDAMAKELLARIRLWMALPEVRRQIDGR